MARVTVEDCIRYVNNRFDLVLLAARRSRDIASGVALTLPRDNDKNAVVALREIAANSVSVPHIRENIIRNFQRTPFVDEHDLHDPELLAMLEHDTYRVAVDNDEDETEEDSDKDDSK